MVPWPAVKPRDTVALLQWKKRKKEENKCQTETQMKELIDQEQDDH
jgi:hypothetical protein